MACREDIRKKILDEVDKVFIEGRYTYYRVNDDTFRVANAKETRGKSKANSLNQAREIAIEVKDRIIAKYGNNVFVEVILPKYIGFPVEIKVTPSDLYIERLFANIPNEKRTETVSRLAFLQDPALYQQELMEDSPLKMIPYEAWLAQNEAPNPIVDEEGVTMFSPTTSENLIPTAFQAEQLTLEFPTVIKPGVPELFESTPELASIGTPQQYSEYLESIFLNSTIEYRGDSFDLERFYYSEPTEEKRKKGVVHKIGPGVYTTRDKDKALSFAIDNKGRAYTTLVNMTDPLVFGDELDFLAAVGEYFKTEFVPSFTQVEQYVRAQHRLGKTIRIDSYDESSSPVENTRILGSKQDIESFKEFIKAKPVVTSVTQIPDVIATMIYQNNNCK